MWTAFLAIYVIWGSTYLAIRFGVESMPPFLMAATRFILPGLLLFGWSRLRGAPAPTPRQWRDTFIVGSLLLGAFAILVTPSEEEPQIQVPMIDVMVGFPGATAEEVVKFGETAV